MSEEEFPFDSYSKLKEKAVKIAEFLIANNKTTAIIAKAHPDNLSAVGIIISCLRKVEAGSHVIILGSSEDIEKRTEETDYSLFIFIGFEARELPDKLLKDEGKQIIILEHKFKIDKRIKAPWEKLHILSLTSFELSTNLLSNAGLAYLIASGFNDDHYKHSGLAILGGLSKKQIDQKTQKLIGVNLLILEEGKKNKILRETTGTRIPGRESQPIHQALQYSNNPFFPGLTGNESACTSFVSKLGIAMKDQDGNFRTISALTSEETKKLNDGLISLLMGERGQPLTEISKLIGPIYILETETKKNQTRNIEEYLWILDGAIQLQKYGLALAVVLGDRENVFDKLIRELSNYHGKATPIIEEIIKNPEITEDLQYFRLIKNQDFFELESAPLVIKALVDSNIIPIDKPLILHIKENSDDYLFVHDSPVNMKEGYLSFQFFQDLRKGEDFKEITVKGDVDFFHTFIEKDKLEPFLDELSKKYASHLEGKDTETK